MWHRFKSEQHNIFFVCKIVLFLLYLLSFSVRCLKMRWKWCFLCQAISATEMHHVFALWGACCYAVWKHKTELCDFLHLWVICGGHVLETHHPFLKISLNLLLFYATIHFRQNIKETHISILITKSLICHFPGPGGFPMPTLLASLSSRV